MIAARLPEVIMLGRSILVFAGVLILSSRIIMGEISPISYKFKLGTGDAPAGHKIVTPETLCSKESGYGFESAEGVTLANPRGTAITGSQPFQFSAALPEGSYKVTVTLGDPEGESTTTIKAELRRLMLEKVETKKGELVSRVFTVNIRTPRIGSTGTNVKLKDREKAGEAMAWDDKLTLEFCDKRPVVSSIQIEKVADNAPVIYLLGDSTVADQSREPWNSWGQMLTRWFKPTIAVANHSESGESYSSAKGARRLDKVVSLLKKGDYVFLQYGHNDMKDSRIDIPKYKELIKSFIDAVKAKDATPVVVTSMERRSGVDKPTLGEFPQAARDVAKAENVPCIDLNASSMIFYKALGKNLKLAFEDGTHHNNYGSYEMSKMIVMGIKQARLDLEKHIVDDFQDFDPAKPDSPEVFNIAPSAGSSTTKPLGD